MAVNTAILIAMAVQQGGQIGNRLGKVFHVEGHVFNQAGRPLLAQAAYLREDAGAQGSLDFLVGFADAVSRRKSEAGPKGSRAFEMAVICSSSCLRVEACVSVSTAVNWGSSALRCGSSTAVRDRISSISAAETRSRGMATTARAAVGKSGK